MAEFMVAKCNTSNVVSASVDNESLTKPHSYVNLWRQADSFV